MEPQAPPQAETYPACSENGYCKINGSKPQCLCKPNYIGNGYNCEPVRGSCSNSSSCYAYGDPHYRSEVNVLCSLFSTIINGNRKCLKQYGTSFKINNTCSYILAADECFGSGIPKYSVIIDHEYRWEKPLVFLKSVRINYDGHAFMIIRTSFYVDGVKVDLPYTGTDFTVKRAELGYIKFESFKLNVFFDGEMALKVKLCAPFKDECGLCKLKSANDFPFIEHLDPQMRNMCSEL